MASGFANVDRTENANRVREMKNYYPWLDLLRFAAASLVVADHLGLYAWSYPSATGPLADAAFPLLSPMSAIGSVGVEIFFLISGFVISASAVGNTPIDFALRRAIRVFPALWVSGFIAALALLSTGVPITSVLADYVRYAVLSPIGPYIDGVVWTLVVEAVFYLLIFITLWWNGTEKFNLVAKILGVLSAIYLLLLTAAVIFYGGSSGETAAPAVLLLGRFPFKVLLLRHGVFFAVGILVWHGFNRGFTSRNRVWLACLLAFCSLEICIDQSEIIAIAIRLGLWWVSFGILLLSMAYRESNSRLTVQLKIARYLGRLSYTLYLNHYTLGLVIVPALATLNLSRLTVFFCVIGIILLVSILVMFPERALQSVLKRAMERWHARHESMTNVLDKRLLKR